MTRTEPSAGIAPRPSFLGIGAGKSGTTWLWHMLRLHASVFLPEQKELHYFNNEAHEGVGTPNPHANRPLSWYLSHFVGAGPDQICGEITPAYLWSVSAPTRVHSFDPHMKLVASLRDPVERVFSSYLFSLQKGEISRCTFEEALEAHPYFAERTLYGRYLTRWYEHFPASQLKVVFYQDIVSCPENVLIDVERFIGVDPYLPDHLAERRNVTGQPSFPRLNRAITGPRIALKRYGLESLVDAAKSIGLGRPVRAIRERVQPYQERPRVSKETEVRLRAYFRDDVEKLERLLGVELDSWKEVTHAD